MSELQNQNSMSDVNRIEIIDENGRAFVRYLEADEKIVTMMQDGGKTIKVFIQKEKK